MHTRVHPYTQSIVQRECVVHIVLVPYKVVWKGPKFKVVWGLSFSLFLSFCNRMFKLIWR